jgi:hypothetical protein
VGWSLHTWWNITNVAILLSLVLFALHYLGFRLLEIYHLGFHVIEAFYPVRIVDFQYWYQIPPLIFEKIEYPSLIPEGWDAGLLFWHINFSYLPSAAALMLPLSALPLLVAFSIWLALQMVCFFAVLFLSIHLASVANWPSRWADHRRRRGACRKSHRLGSAKSQCEPDLSCTCARRHCNWAHLGWREFASAEL